MEFQFHPAAGEFPMMNDGEFSDLKNDMQVNGLMEPIMICDGMILDGRNRYRACQELNIEPKFEEFKGDDPWAYVWSLNAERRHLTNDQKYLIWDSLVEKSETWKAKKEEIDEEANKARSAAALDQPRTETGFAEKEQVAGQHVPQPDRHKIRKAKAIASNTDQGAVARCERLKKKRPDLAQKVRKGEMKSAEAHKQMKKDAKDKQIPKSGKALMIAKKAITILERIKKEDPEWETAFARVEQRIKEKRDYWKGN